MNERELLEMAAKACGYKLDLEIRPDGLPFFHSERRALALDSGGWFAAGVDDGDCARTEAALGIDVMWFEEEVYSAAEDGHCSEMYSSHQGDKQSARRMATLRVAAFIGKAMP